MRRQTHQKKREVSGTLRKIIAADVFLTDRFCNWANCFLPFRSLRVHYKALEISCHGIPWLTGWMAFIWLVDSRSLYQMQVNFFIGLLLDILFVCVLKAFTRRRRPTANQSDMFATVGPDKYSFPSGHASRACFIAVFFIFLYPLFFIFYMPLMAWSISICMSRLLLRRHHSLDIIGGVLLGVFEAVLLSWLWVSEDFAVWIVSWLSDEKLEGGSYHV
ncbi:phospholipid phosphatase 6 isoform X3 [Zootermopsis nevadensis]|uniref:phospholipid phosphatase 6 isoform X3 n=1 Tax=Zootermopsis nevadensis TaxID=136037 RepID=UPI000B8E9392|nr:phospholipid phosphatase 6 isoform X3 [Zootermopsis nevadensis]